MFKLLFILLVVVIVMRGFVRLMYPRMPDKPARPLELKACEYCGILTREDLSVIRRGRFFCTEEHAKRFFN